MNGYSGHTLVWWNEAGQYFWVKLQFKTAQGIKNLTREEAARLAGETPDFATEDLFDAVERGEYPVWNVFVQVMAAEEVERYRFDFSDITKGLAPRRCSPHSGRSDGT